MEERISNTKGITLEINESKSQHNIIKDCSLKGKPGKCVSTVVKYINDFPTYIYFCTAPTYIMQIYIYHRDL